MTEHAVVIAGGGPTGLMLAGELALAGVDVAIVERRERQELASARAGGLHSRTIEVFDQRGIAERFLSQGKVRQVAGFSFIPLDISDFPTRHNYGLALWQTRIEPIMADWVGELPVKFYRGRGVTGFAQDDSGVDIELSHGASLRAKYLVGCDGGRSLIRKQAGIDFPGWDASTSYLIAEVEMADEPAWGVRRGEKGVNALGKREDGKGVGVVLVEPLVGKDDEPTLGDLREALIAVYGTDFGVRNPSWLSRFTDMARQATSYRDRRVLLAGDAAHVHAPAGGQGLNIGVQDAVNLGWKLAQVVKGTSPESLLDTYHAERHPIGARVLRLTMAQTALGRGDDRTWALRETMTDLLQMDAPLPKAATEALPPAGSCHVTAVDAAGNVATALHSCMSLPWSNGLFVDGVTIVASGAHFFRVMPGPGERASVYVAPCMVMTGGKPTIACGSPSGSLLQNIVQNYTNMLDFGVPLPESVNRPRFGNAYTAVGGALLAVEADFRKDVADAVRARGMALDTVNSQNYGMGSFEGIHIDPSTGVRTARGDTRRCSMAEAV